MIVMQVFQTATKTSRNRRATRTSYLSQVQLCIPPCYYNIARWQEFAFPRREFCFFLNTEFIFFSTTTKIQNSVFPTLPPPARSLCRDGPPKRVSLSGFGANPRAPREKGSRQQSLKDCGRGSRWWKHNLTIAYFSNKKNTEFFIFQKKIQNSVFFQKSIHDIAVIII